LDFKKKIDFYGNDLQDFEISPFEMVQTLHVRTKFYRYHDELTSDEKLLLKKYDKLLLDNVKKFYDHMKRIYNFSNDKPMEQWWWHLDKILNHELSIDLENNTVTKTYLSTIVDFPTKEA
jgi:hypothetical protein